ncbi:CPBP family intramembrane metalloprotease [Ancylomarina sp. DW003]|nr:CPBP family intramembrane glutamic endopeptidase [Ancylomarina sp. DW003]MDE5423746.1 CPBP family intramembrane metalloprotease [Ancylomarina sp. DW003]
MQYLERALKGPNQWWKYILVPIITFLAQGFLGMLPLGLVIGVIIASNNGEGDFSNILDFEAQGIDLNLGLALMIISFAVGLWVLKAIVEAYHKRTLSEQINGTKKIRWNRFFYAAGIWGGLMLINLIAEYFLNPGDFTLNFNVSTFIPLVLVALLLIPFQTTFEEVLFRGYLAQGVARWTRSRWMAAILPAVLFGLMHYANPEVKEYGFWVMMPHYIIFGVFFGLMAVLDDGIETAMGAHAANNAFIAIFTTSNASVFQTNALFKVKDMAPTLYDLFLFILLGAILISILAKKYNWNFALMNQRVEGDKE